MKLQIIDMNLNENVNFCEDIVDTDVLLSNLLDNKMTINKQDFVFYCYCRDDLCNCIYTETDSSHPYFILDINEGETYIFIRIINKSNNSTILTRIDKVLFDRDDLEVGSIIFIAGFDNNNNIFLI